MSKTEKASCLRDRAHGTEGVQLEQQMDRTVQRAVGSGINVELLWSVFETRLRRAVNGGNGR